MSVRIAVALLLLLSVTMLGGCVAPATQPRASADREAEAKTFASNPQAARIYIYNGIVRGVLSDSDYPVAIDYYVNDQYLGGLNPDQFFMIEVPPGAYGIKWTQRSSIDTMGDPIAFNVRAGDVLFLRSVFDKRAATALGAAGAALTTSHVVELAPAGQSDMARRTLVEANRAAFTASAVQPPPAAAPLPAGPVGGGKTVEDKLSELKALRDKGLIPEALYQERVKAILGGI